MNGLSLLFVAVAILGLLGVVFADSNGARIASIGVAVFSAAGAVAAQLESRRHGRRDHDA